MAPPIQLPKNMGMGIRALKARGLLSQSEFAKIIRISQGSVSRIEQGQVPSGDILYRIAKHGKTTMEYILKGEKE